MFHAQCSASSRAARFQFEIADRALWKWSEHENFSGRRHCIVRVCGFCGYEPRPGGATAGQYRRRAQEQDSRAALASLPDWAGIWTFDFPTPGGPKPEEPSLTPASAAELKVLLAEEAKNQEPATESANCLPPGMPTIMFQPYDIEFLFTPGRVTIIQEAYMQVRRVFTDGRSHPADLDPTFNGHSIGHWEGDTSGNRYRRTRAQNSARIQSPSARTATARGRTNSSAFARQDGRSNDLDRPRRAGETMAHGHERTRATATWTSWNSSAKKTTAIRSTRTATSRL